MDELVVEMKKKKNLLKSYLVEATNTAIYLMNWCTTSGVHDVTLHEKYYGRKSDLSHPQIFSTIA